MSQHFAKVFDGLDVDSLARTLVRRPELFGTRPARQNVDIHAEMRDIWVRHNDYSLIESGRFNDEHDSKWYPESVEVPQVRTLASALMSVVEGERLGGILITKLPPGGVIKPHVDSGWHASYYDKFFVPIQNDPGAVFGFPDGVIHATPGEAWWFRNDVPHWVRNDSPRDRIALIVCIRTFKGV